MCGQGVVGGGGWHVWGQQEGWGGGGWQLLKVKAAFPTFPQE